MLEAAVHAALLTVHVVSGGLALILGPVAMLLPKRHSRVGVAYQASVAVLFVSAIGLTVMHSVLWGLDVMVAATWALALAGWWVRQYRPQGWLPLHVTFMCGSYITLVTTFLVVNLGLGSVIAWALPTVIGAPVIAWRSAVAARQSRGVAGASSDGNAAQAYPSRLLGSEVVGAEGLFDEGDGLGGRR